MTNFANWFIALFAIIKSEDGYLIFAIGILIGLCIGTLLHSKIKDFLFLPWEKTIEKIESLWAIITKSVTAQAKYAIDSKKESSRQYVEKHLPDAENKGNPEIWYHLGIAYYHGNGVKKSKQDAVYWFHKAAEQGFDAAQINLGICYDDGIGVDKDKIEAGYWYRKAAEQGHIKAQFNLGLLYWNSKGIIANKCKAYTWVLIAKSSGDKKAEKWLNKKQWDFLLTSSNIRSAEQEAERIYNEIENRWIKEEKSSSPLPPPLSGD